LLISVAQSTRCGIGRAIVYYSPYQSHGRRGLGLFDKIKESFQEAVIDPIVDLVEDGVSATTGAMADALEAVGLDGKLSESLSFTSSEFDQEFDIPPPPPPPSPITYDPAYETNVQSPPPPPSSPHPSPPPPPPSPPPPPRLQFDSCMCECLF
jgi:hypothetical protein